MLGFIYIVEYTGSLLQLQGKKYIGSKHYNKGSPWETYLGTPTSAKDAVVLLWREQLKKCPSDFRRTIIREVMNSEKILNVEREVMAEYGVTTNAESCWINRGIPSHKNMNTAEAIQKRKKTCKDRYGVDHPSQTEKRRKAFSVLMHTEERRKKRGASISAALKSLSKKDWDTIIRKRVTAYKQWASQNKEVLSERSKLHTPQHYVTLQRADNNCIESRFITDWSAILSVGTGTIQKRIRGVTNSPLIDANNNSYIYIKTEKIKPCDVLL
jgi:hypothetical protein